MKSISTTAAIGALIAAGAIALGAGSASARVVCNAQGDCWHTDVRATYGQRFETHPDDWYFHQTWNQDSKRHWRDYHDGLGYYANGVWMPR
ncbi:hypothetical protein [Phenylobacterium sp.]|uniref:hypothetical protein n=1 Tax=Phenylobacterium sp. TaxID=1871053 RepID=UPI0012286DB4|nr:hypothetical protein [Phenylobacterium sp.]THD58424.1 MAG: hypothetical protein E8A49_19645 [Phenylobacterium sp.]